MTSAELAALTRNTARSTSLLSYRLGELARALETSDQAEIGYLTVALDRELSSFWNLLEQMELELGDLK